MLATLVVGCPDQGRSPPAAATPPVKLRAAGAELEGPAPEGKAESREPATPRAGEATAPAGPAVHEATRAEAEATLEDLRAWVRAGATDPANAWAMAHGLVAFGQDLRAADGRLVIDAIVHDHAEVRPASSGDQHPHRFPELSPAGLPVEPHRDLIVKTLLEVDVPLERRFSLADGSTVTLGALVADASDAFRFPEDEVDARDYAWSATAALLGAARRHPGDTGAAVVRPGSDSPPRSTAPEGERGRRAAREDAGALTVADVAERTMAELEKAQDFLEAPMRAGRPDRVEKRRQGIYAHSCGGLHLVQAAVLGAALTRDPALLARARHQLDLVFFRWNAERRIYRMAEAQQPGYRWVLLIQELKFHGHALETMALARDWGVLAADGATKQKIRRITGDLVDTVRALAPAYTKARAAPGTADQTYYDLIGDGCHAIRGLRRALVAFLST